MTRKHKLEITESDGRRAVFLNDFRVSGPETKQEQGIKILHRFDLDHNLLATAINSWRLKVE